MNALINAALYRVLKGVFLEKLLQPHIGVNSICLFFKTKLPQTGIISIFYTGTAKEFLVPYANYDSPPSKQSKMRSQE